MVIVRPPVVFLLALALLIALPAQAQVWRWVDANGTTHYAQSPPPAGVRATRLDIAVREGPPSADALECHTWRCQAERMEQRTARRAAGEAREAELRAQAAANAPQGMTLTVFNRITRGMSEGELLVVAGRPDLSHDDGAALGVPMFAPMAGGRGIAPARALQRVRTLIWLPTGSDPFTTTVTLIGGRVSELERARRF